MLTSATLDRGMTAPVGAVMAMFALSSVDDLKTVSPLGFGLLLVSSLSCAVSNVYMRYVKQDYSPVSISFCSALVGTVVFWALAAARYLPGGNMGDFFAPLANPAFVFTSLYLGTFSTLITGALISGGSLFLLLIPLILWLFHRRMERQRRREMSLAVIIKATQPTEE